MHRTRRRHAIVVALICGILYGLASQAQAARIKDIAHFEGVRDNQLLGYGLVVGLDGTGDNQQAEFTLQSTAAMLSRMGIRVDPKQLLLRNVAAVIVTSSLPGFAQAGSRIDTLVSSIGNARSLAGGTLLMTPLSSVTGETYAMAQGAVQVGGFGASGGSGGIQKNHLNVGRIPAGAIVEREVEHRLVLNAAGTLKLQINTPDFSTARNITDAINRASGMLGGKGKIALLVNSGTVVMKVPEKMRKDTGRFISYVESIEIYPDAIARVVINSRTGTVVLGENVRISTVGVAHGGLTVRVEGSTQVSQPGALSGGSTVVTPLSRVTATEESGSIQMVEGGASLSELVQALNALGAKPRDLIDILQAIRKAGGLHAHVEVM
jgi:flagellar P-ring protein precursor FlgI